MKTIEEILVKCIEQHDTFGSDTLYFFNNGVKFAKVEIDEGNTIAASLIPAGYQPFVNVDSEIKVKITRIALPDKELKSHRISQNEFNNNQINFSINVDCQYNIRVIVPHLYSIIRDISKI